MRKNLERLFRPKSIAVIGGGTWCKNVILKCAEIGFDGPVWPVHPKRLELAGRKTYATVSELPHPPDATFIGINRHATIEVVRALNDIGAGGAVCFASGFLEAENETGDGADLQRDLLAAAGDMTVIGPNCYGFINYLDGALLWPDQHGGLRTDRGVAILTQSSNIAINLTMQRRGLPIGYMVTTGNQAQTGMAEIGAALLADERVTALGIHIEGVGDLRAFEALARTARAVGKPIVVLKVGRSEQSRAATISHTASLAGSDAGSNALFKRLGIGQVDTLPEFLETLKLLHVVGPLSSNRLASMSCSGGEASLMADLAVGRDVSFPNLTENQHSELAKTLGPMVKRANPLDYHTFIWADTDAMRRTYGAMMTDQIGLGLVVLDFPRSDRGDATEWNTVIDAVVAAKENSGRPIAIVASLPENMPEPIAEKLVELGITPLCGLQEAIIAAEIAANEYIPGETQEELLLPRLPPSPAVLNELSAKKSIEKHGIKIPLHQHAKTPALAGAAAKTIGFPVVLKGLGVAHKTEAGAVVLNLTTESEVVEAAEMMSCDGFLVEEMVTDAIAELLIGVVMDPAHGYVLTVGAGGTLTELLDDKTSLLIPAQENDVLAALKALKIWKLLNGYRGRPAANIPAIVQAVMAVQAYVQATHGDILEIEINPLICRETDAVAADALIMEGELNDR